MQRKGAWLKPKKGGKSLRAGPVNKVKEEKKTEGAGQGEADWHSTSSSYNIAEGVRLGHNGKGFILQQSG